MTGVTERREVVATSHSAPNLNQLQKIHAPFQSDD